MVLGPGPHRLEEGLEVVEHQIEVRHEGPKPGWSAVTGEVCGKARKAVTGEEGGGQLHGPAGVVAVTVDHEDQGTRPSDKWGPGASKERPTRWGREVGRGAGDAV